MDSNLRSDLEGHINPELHPRKQSIQTFLTILGERQNSAPCYPPSEAQLEELLRQDREINRAWSGRINFVTGVSRWLAKWLPYHDLGLLGQQDFDSLLDVFYYHWHHYSLSYQRDRGPKQYPELLTLLKEVRQLLPIQSDPYCQQPCTPETSVMRALYCLFEFPQAKRILLLGDDDLTSLSLAWLASQARRNIEIVAVDVDTALLDAIRTTSQDWNVKVTATTVDLFGPEADSLVDFDIVMADPSYEEIWIKQFGEVAKKSLAEGGYFLLSFPKPAGRQWFGSWLDDFSTTQSMSLNRREVAFSEYPMPGNRSKWLGRILRNFFPLSAKLVDQYEQLPYLYADLWVFRKGWEQ